MSSSLSDLSRINPLVWGIQKISSGIGSAVINPIMDVVYYSFPRVKVLLDNHVELSTKITDNNEKIPHPLKEETTAIARASGIVKAKEVSIYTALQTKHPTGYKGFFDQLITVPEECTHVALEEISASNMPGRLDDKALKNANFSGHEVRYLISSGIAASQTAPMLKLCARIVIIALIIGLYFSPLSFASSIVIFALASALYLAIDRWVAGKTDELAVNILAKRLGEAGIENPILRASEIARNTLRKFQLRELAFLESVDRESPGTYSNKLCHFLISPEGDLRFDFSRPSLQKRIEKIEKAYEDASTSSSKSESSFL